MTTASASGMKRYVAVYFALLVLMALQFFLGYQGQGDSWSCAFSPLPLLRPF